MGLAAQGARCRPATLDWSVCHWSVCHSGLVSVSLVSVTQWTGQCDTLDWPVRHTALVSVSLVSVTQWTGQCVTGQCDTVDWSVCHTGLVSASLVSVSHCGLVSVRLTAGLVCTCPHAEDSSSSTCRADTSYGRSLDASLKASSRRRPCSPPTTRTLFTSTPAGRRSECFVSPTANWLETTHAAAR